MAWLIAFLVILAIAWGVFKSIGLGGVIIMMITGGVGFAVGSVFETGWAVFGAILGGLLGIYGSYRNRRG